VSIKDKYNIERITFDDCREWLLYKHYAHRIPSISYAFGLFENGILKGVCTFGSPPSHSLCIGVCGIENKDYVLELNRLIVESIKKNTTSFFVAQCLNKIDGKKIIISFADTSQNHTGYIYQATNFIYTGLSAKRTERYDIDNPNRHSKSVTEKHGAIYQDLAIRDRPQKHRYIYFIGTKKEKKEFLKALKYPIQPYPKGQNKNYDASYEPTIQGRLF
jgi:hypothetical protein